MNPDQDSWGCGHLEVIVALNSPPTLRRAMSGSGKSLQNLQIRRKVMNGVGNFKIKSQTLDRSNFFRCFAILHDRWVKKLMKKLHHSFTYWIFQTQVQKLMYFSIYCVEKLTCKHEHYCSCRFSYPSYRETA